MPGEPSLWSNSHESTWREFKEARSFARELGLSHPEQWKNYISREIENTAELPKDIPSEPDKEYKHIGWVSWHDWLGIELQTKQKLGSTLWDGQTDNRWIPFESAREFARSLDLEYEEDWQALWKGTIQRDIEIPKDIPENPEEIYNHSGWKSWKEWLMHPESQAEYSEFKKVREFVRCLHLKSKTEWFEYMIEDRSSEHLNYGISLPKRPHLEYRDEGWISWNDFLKPAEPFIPYEKAASLIQRLKFRSKMGWDEYCWGLNVKHQKRTNRIPCYPDLAYKTSGWESWEKWLGLSQSSNANIAVENQDGLIECKCKGRVKDCLDCDGKGYID